MLYEQVQKLNFPPVLLCDMRPVEKFLILFVLDNEIAEQVTRPSKQYTMSMPKHPSIQQLAPLVGARSLVTTDVSLASSMRSHIRKMRSNDILRTRVTNGKIYIREFGPGFNRSISLVM